MIIFTQVEADYFAEAARRGQRTSCQAQDMIVPTGQVQVFDLVFPSPERLEVTPWDHPVGLSLIHI